MKKSSKKKAPTVPKEPNIYWMTLNHPTAMLHLHEYPAGSEKYEAWFGAADDLTQNDIIPLVARGLRREMRFANQLERPISVLEHEMGLWYFASKENLGMSIMMQAIFHDTPEAFGFGDVPSHMKSDHDEKREAAIYAAFQWPVPALTAKDNATGVIFKYWDGLAGAAEAFIYGKCQWPWMLRVLKEQGRDLHRYMEVFQQINPDLDLLEDAWIKLAKNFCEKAGTLHNPYKKVG